MPFLFFAVVHFFFHSFIWQLQKEGSLKRKLFAVYIHRLEPLMFRSSRSGVFCKNMFLKISRNSQKSTSVGVSFLVAVSGLRHLGTPTQVFSCELCVMFKTPVAIENLRLLLRNVRQRCQWDTKKNSLVFSWTIAQSKMFAKISRNLLWLCLPNFSEATYKALERNYPLVMKCHFHIFGRDPNTNCSCKIPNC